MRKATWTGTNSEPRQAAYIVEGKRSQDAYDEISINEQPRADRNFQGKRGPSRWDIVGGTARIC